MVEGAALLHQIDPATLIRPAVVIDISAAGAADPDCVLTLDQVAAFEAANGRIATGSVVLLRTGWDAFNSDLDRYGAGAGQSSGSRATARMRHGCWSRSGVSSAWASTP